MKRTATILAALTAVSVNAQTNTCTLANAYGDLLKAVSANALVTADILLAATAQAGYATTAASVKCGYTAGTTLICADEAKLIPAIQQYADDLKEDLAALATTRDEYIIQQRGEVVKVYESVKQLYALREADIPAAYLAIAGSFVGYAEEIAADFTAIVENFETYQTTRATCMDALIQSQAALLCSAALDTAPAAGFTGTAGSEAASFDDTFVGQLSTACYPYLTHSATQSSIILTAVYGSGLSSLATALQNLVDGDATAAAENLTAAFTAFAKVSQSSTTVEKPVAVPTTCTSAAACISWFDAIFGTDGILNKDTAILGGDLVTPSFVIARNLEEGNERRLAATGMALDLTDFTFTTGFEQNPGDVDNTENANSALRNGVTACAVAALALLF